MIVQWKTCCMDIERDMVMAAMDATMGTRIVAHVSFFVPAVVVSMAALIQMYGHATHIGGTICSGAWLSQKFACKACPHLCHAGSTSG